MRAQTWARDLGGATWRIVVGVLGAAFTVAAVVSAVLGAHVATPWLVVGALACLLVIVFMAYVRAARDRDASPSPEQTELMRRIAALEDQRVTVGETVYATDPDESARIKERLNRLEQNPTVEAREVE